MRLGALDIRMPLSNREVTGVGNRGSVRASKVSGITPNTPTRQHAGSVVTLDADFGRTDLGVSLLLCRVVCRSCAQSDTQTIQNTLLPTLTMQI